MIQITPVSAAVGGFTLGVSTLFFRVVFGRVLGISGIFGRIFDDKTSDKYWRIAFSLGLFVSGLMLPSIPQAMPRDLLTLIGSGLLVGFGTTLGSGCTSGHGLVGLARLSLRSWVAVPTFMLTAIVTRTLLLDIPFIDTAPVWDFSIALRAEYLIGSAIGIFGLAYWTSPIFKKTHHVDSLMNIYSFVIGGLFGLGLIVGGMTVPQKVFDFLQLGTVVLPRPEGTYAPFDPSLMVVMMAGMLPNLFLFRVVEQTCEEPLLTKEHCMPTNRKITWQLIVGAAVFGIGWGWGGMCPGPALVQTSRVLLGDWDILKWVAGFIVGSKVAQIIN
jgi:uncharacterized membrane protein YedE/YeeE